jgi:hypothetical protein
LTHIELLKNTYGNDLQAMEWFIESCIKRCSEKDQFNWKAYFDAKRKVLNIKKEINFIRGEEKTLIHRLPQLEKDLKNTERLIERMNRECDYKMDAERGIEMSDNELKLSNQNDQQMGLKPDLQTKIQKLNLQSNKGIKCETEQRNSLTLNIQDNQLVQGVRENQ